MKRLNKYVLRFYLKHLLRHYRYLIFIKYVNNKVCTKLRNQGLQLDNIASEVFYASIVKTVFCNYNLNFLKSKSLVLATNDFDTVTKIINFDLGSDFLFFCFDGIFLNSDISRLNELQSSYNNLFLLNFYIVYCYIYLVLVIYSLILVFFELLNVILNIKIDGTIKLSIQ
jgi:hypothetical protein